MARRRERIISETTEEREACLSRSRAQEKAWCAYNHIDLALYAVENFLSWMTKWENALNGIVKISCLLSYSYNVEGRFDDRLHLHKVILPLLLHNISSSNNLHWYLKTSSRLSPVHIPFADQFCIYSANHYCIIFSHYIIDLYNTPPWFGLLPFAHNALVITCACVHCFRNCYFQRQGDHK